MFTVGKRRFRVGFHMGHALRSEKIDWMEARISVNSPLSGVLASVALHGHKQTCRGLRAVNRLLAKFGICGV